MRNHILYCHCAYADVVPKDVKEQVLKALTESNIAFEAVSDLCDMSANKDSSLKKFAENNPLTIVACFPRVVKWLFHGAGAPLKKEGVQILNMRTDTAEAVTASLLEEKSSSPEVHDQ